MQTLASLDVQDETAQACSWVRDTWRHSMREIFSSACECACVCVCVCVDGHCQLEWQSGRGNDLR